MGPPPNTYQPVPDNQIFPAWERYLKLGALGALLPVGTGVNANALISFNPTSFKMDILKDIAVTGLLAGSASVTDIGQSFTQVVPEPGTAGFAALGLLAGAFARYSRRKRKSGL